MNCRPANPSEPRSAPVLFGDTESVFVRESQLSEKVGGKIRCNVCERRCLLVPGGFGWCRTRQHRDGRLLTLIYGAVSSPAANPIEKKPFYHFHPGTSAMTAGSWSCNFGCPWCQNWDISKTPPPATGHYVSPERFVQLATESACQGTSISFNEPALSLEWSLDVFPLARRRGLYNTFVTNGYMTPECLSLLIEAGLDAMNVDIKGDSATSSAVKISVMVSLRHPRGLLPKTRLFAENLDRVLPASTGFSPFASGASPRFLHVFALFSKLLIPRQI